MLPREKGPVLVVDDDPDIRDALRELLEEEGYAAVEASDGLDALRYLGTNPPPSLILLDWNMAPMNASAFMQELIKVPGHERMVVVLLTADARAKEKAALGGYAAYLQKPVDLDVLFSLLERYA